MKNPFIKEWLGRIREDLRAGDTEQLTMHVEQAGLALLLDPEFLEEARRTDARQVVVLIAALGIANTEMPAQYQRLLATYQCFMGQQEVDEAAKACADAVGGHFGYYKGLLTAMIDHKAEFLVERTPANADDLLFGMQMMIDAGCSLKLLPLLKAWKSVDPTDKPWLMASRVIVQRLQQRHSVSESAQLAKTLDALLAIAPESQAAVGKTLLEELVKVALDAKLGDLSFKAAEKLISIKPDLEERFFLIRALMLQGKLDVADQYADALLFDMAKNPKAFGSDESDLREIFNIQNAIDTLKTVNAALRKKGMKPFLMSGTLLGYQRNRSLLPHDKDLDMGLIGWDQQFTLVQALLELGHFEIDLSEIRGDKSHLISVVDVRNGMPIDFFLFHDKGDHFLHGIDFDYGFTENLRFSKFELVDVEFLGDIFSVPSDIDKNLTENYGDWRTPEKSYVVTVESPAIVGKGGRIHKLIGKLELMKTISQRLPVARGDRILKCFQDLGVELVTETTLSALNDWSSKNQVTKSKRLTDLLAKLKVKSIEKDNYFNPPGSNNESKKILLISHGFGADGASIMLKNVAKFWVNEFGWKVDAYCDASSSDVLSGLQPIGAVFDVNFTEYDLIIVNGIRSADAVQKIPNGVSKLLWVHEGLSVVANSKNTFADWDSVLSAYDALIFQTEWQVNEVFRDYLINIDQEKINIIPNGVLWPYDARLDLGKKNNDDVFELVCVASLTDRKRPQDLAQSVIELSRHMKIKCTFIGDLTRIDTLPIDFQKMIIRNDNENLDFLGVKSQDEIHRELISADAFCLPSSDETYGLSPLEAAMTGVPVILTELPPYESIGWKNGDNCLMYKVGDIEGLSQKIKLLAGNPAVGARLAGSALKMAQKFPFDEFCRKMTKAVSLYM